MKRKIMKPVLKTPVEKTVRKANTSITRKRDGIEDTIEEGSVSELPVKRRPSNVSAPTVGMSKGITKNMANYESLRIDVWYSDFVEKDETPDEALVRVEAVVDRVLENSVSYYLDD